MKIRITKPLQVEKSIRPEVGSVHEVVGRQSLFPICPTASRRPEMFFIRVGQARVGVRPDECEIVEETPDE